MSYFSKNRHKGGLLINKYIDLNTHILPNMEECGPSTIEEAAECLRLMADSGMKTVAATPLFDPSIQEISEFMAQRDTAIAQLRAVSDGMLRIVAGAEVVLCQKTLECKAMQALRIEGTEYILLRLPEQLDAETFSLLDRFQIASHSQLVLTGVEHLLSSNHLEAVFELNRMGCLLQIYARSLLDQQLRKPVLYLLGNHIAHFVGSGLHTAEQASCYPEAMRVLKRSLPLEKYKRIKSNPSMLLSNAALSEIL